MPRTIVFDVNETLLDLRGLEAPFRDAFGVAAARGEWFTELLHQMLVTTVTGPYVDFSTLGDAALQVVAARRNVPLSDDDRRTILEAMRTLPPHEDVVESLKRLEAVGLRLVALSNGTPDVLRDQLDHAGLTRYFDRIFSADAAQRLKPAPEPYRMTARELGVSVEELRLVAAHAWDTTGAQRAGCAAAFVARPGKRLGPTDPVPDIVGDDLDAVSMRILAAEGGAPRYA